MTSMALIKRLLRMHGCTVLIVPKPLCRQLDLKPGDYVQIDRIPGAAAGRFDKLLIKDTTHEPAKRSPLKPH